jgi:hypothetical protein
VSGGSGRAWSITDLAAQEGVTVAYVCRLLPLIYLAPDIVEAILDGRQPKGLRLVEMLRNGPLVWEKQRSDSGFSRSSVLRPAALHLALALRRMPIISASEPVSGITPR